MITKNDIKYFASLNLKKYRNQEKKFLAEGIKIVTEGIESYYPCELVLVTYEFAENNENLIKKLKRKNIRIELLNSPDFQKISDTKTPQGIIGVFKFEKLIFYPSKEHPNVIIYVDNVSDPGNLGTILRTCDWFGLSEILISPQSSEYLNPKVIRASMGSVFHLTIYDDVDFDVVNKIKSNGYKVICSDLEGENLFNFRFQDKCLITLSSESSGPSKDILSLADKSITIPRVGAAESLNVAVAAGIIISKTIEHG
jgi:TrmH family RNA methyltransferase